VLGFLTIHFTAIILYTLPDSKVDNRARNYSQAYVRPLFHMNFDMFVPPPTVNMKMYIQYENNDGYLTDWLDPVDDFKNKHEKYRITHHGRVTLAASSLMYKLYGHFAQQTAPYKNNRVAFYERYLKQNKRYDSSIKYLNAATKTYLRGLFKYKGQSVPSYIKVKCVFHEYKEAFSDAYNEVILNYPTFDLND